MEQYNDKEGIEESMEIARLRFGMIAPVIQETYPDESIMAYCRRVSKIPMQLPDGRTVSYKPKTIGKWVSLYRNGGIDALAPKRRSDLGNTRVLTEDAIEEIYQIKKMFLAVGVKVTYLKRIQFGDFTLDPDLATGDYRPLNREELAIIKKYLEKS